MLKPAYRVLLLIYTYLKTRRVLPAEDAGAVWLGESDAGCVMRACAFTVYGERGRGQDGGMERDWFCLLYDEHEKLSKAYRPWIELCGKGDLADQFAHLNELTRTKAEAAIRAFAKAGTWPELDHITGSMVMERLDAAVDMTEILRFLGKTAGARCRRPKRTKEEWLLWYLIAAWNEVGFVERHSSLENLRRGDEPGSFPWSTSAEGQQFGAV